jgi:myo-inositol-1(or 4)-monophosphatase
MADRPNLHEIAAFLDELCDTSARAILPLFRTTLAIDNKLAGQQFDPVTAADRAAEAVMRELILARFPDHGILGEEYGDDRIDSEHVWVLDPIDGTRAFICGLPTWGTLIGLTEAGKPVLGAMNQPFTGERFAGDTKRAWYRGPDGSRDLKTRACADAADAVMLTTTPALFQGDDRAIYDRIEAKVRLARYGTDCYGYAMVAAGQADLVIECGLKPYDIVALIPIIEGAGGIVTSWTGGSAAQGGHVLACGDPRLHEKMLAKLAVAA